MLILRIAALAWLLTQAYHLVKLHQLKKAEQQTIMVIYDDDNYEEFCQMDLENDLSPHDNDKYAFCQSRI